MNHIYLQPGQVLSKAWKIFNANAGKHVLVFLLALFLIVIFSVLSEKNAGLSLLNTLVQTVISFFLMGYSLHAVYGKSLDINEVFSSSVTARKIFWYILYTIAVSILVIGLIILILFIGFGSAGFSMLMSGDMSGLDESPSALYIFFILIIIVLLVLFIYFGIRLMFVGFFIIDKDDDAIAAVQHSWEITSGNVMNLFLLGILGTAVTFLGLLVFIVGLIVAVPVVYFMQAEAYRILSQKLSTQESEV
jgi:uncharacterized membrane protein